MHQNNYQFLPFSDIPRFHTNPDQTTIPQGDTTTLVCVGPYIAGATYKHIFLRTVSGGQTTTLHESTDGTNYVAYYKLTTAEKINGEYSCAVTANDGKEMTSPSVARIFNGKNLFFWPTEHMSE